MTSRRSTSSVSTASGGLNEVALVEEPGVEADNLVTGGAQHRDHLDADVAEMTCHENLHRVPFRSLSNLSAAPRVADAIT